MEGGALMSVRMRGPSGQTVDVAENEVDYYSGRGFTPLSSEQEYAEAEAAAAAPDDRGVIGSISAATTGFLSGATLGGSDMLLSSLATQNEREQLRDDRRANTTISTIAEIGGGLAASLAAPGSVLARTPAGILSSAANEGVAAARALGGARGFAGQAAVTGAEAAAQNVGSYLGSVALGDRDLTAEGLGGALGAGFAMGAAGGAAVYGLEKGSIAARRMFSQVMEGGDDAAARAAGEWERRGIELTEANNATLAEAKARLAAASQAVEDARLGQMRAGQYVADERVLAQRMGAEAPAITDDVVPPAPVAAGPDPVAAMEARIRAGEVASEPGPFTPDGLRAAAEREVAREGQRTAMGGFEFSPRTGSALSEARKGPGPTKPSGPAAGPAPGTFGADDYDPFAVAPPPLKKAAPQPRGDAPPAELFAKSNLAAKFDDSGREVELRLMGADGQAGRLRMVRDKAGEYRLSHVEIGSDALKGKGLGTAMYREMADYLKAKYNAPLLSDYSRSPSAERVWERLTKEGKARAVFEKGDPPDGPPSYYVMEGGRGSAKSAPPGQERLAAAIAEVEEADPLWRALIGTKAQLDEGLPLVAIGTAARAQPVSPGQLTKQYDELVDQAATAADIETKQALLRQASVIEDQLASAPHASQALAGLDYDIANVQRYERAYANLADELGEVAHPLTREMADGFRKAEGAAESAMTSRATQAIDDMADRGGMPGLFDKPTGEQFGPFESVGPTRLSGKERIAYAKARKTEADAALRGAQVIEGETRKSYKAAKASAADTKRAATTIGLPGGAAAPSAGGAGGTQRAADIGGLLELADMAGIVGLPKPSDLPIVGPALGMYLKFRALKGGAERLMGRVPASGNAKVAALAAQTKDRAARVVDKMLGYAERGAPKMRTVAAVAGPRLLEAIRERIHDDGNPAPSKDAGLQEHTAARAREIGALAADPSLIARQVRKEMGGVADPAMVDAAVRFRTNQIAYLDKVRPKEPPPSPFRRPGEWKPDKVTAADFARRYAVAMDPVQALEQIEQKCLTPEAAEAYRAVYPLLFAQTRDRMLSQAAQLRTSLPRSQLTRMSILFDLPLDSSLEPANLSQLQGVFSATRPADQAPQQTPPASSIAGSTNLTALYQTASDRRAAAR